MLSSVTPAKHAFVSLRAPSTGPTTFRDPTLIDIDSALSGPLCRWVRAVRLHAWLVLLSCAAATVGSGVYAGANLGINSDTIQLFPEHLPARRNHDAFVALFPDLENALLIVVDGTTPESARSAARSLIETLSGDRDNFEDVYLPGGGPFFERHALLYQSIDNLDEFSDRMIQVQPVIGELERDPSISNMASLIAQAFEQISFDRNSAPDSDPKNDALWSEIFDRIGDASVEIYREHPLAISWEGLIVGGSAVDVVTRRVILAHPVLDFADALPARGPLAAIRTAAAELQREGDSQLKIRITGNPALTHEETLSLAWISASPAVSVYYSSVSSCCSPCARGPLVAGVVTTLLTGLVWTAVLLRSPWETSMSSRSQRASCFWVSGSTLACIWECVTRTCFAVGDSHATAIEEAATKRGGIPGHLHAHDRDRLLCLPADGLSREWRSWD